jgi:hypothetical protein
MKRTGRRAGWIVAAVMMVAALGMSGAGAAAPGPEQIGAWTAPFEEGGVAQERCRQDPDGVEGQLVCKPTAVSAAVLPDGRVWYSDGLTNLESWRYSAGEWANRARDSQTRVLDLTAGVPAWSTPEPENGGGTNANIDEGSAFGEDPFGTLGAPGRPGDGRFGSFWGSIGGPEQNPSDPPDDVQENDLDFFCSDEAQLPDGRVLIAGGTDWYGEPVVLDRDTGDPQDFTISELEGLRLARVFDSSSDRYTNAQDMKFGRWYPTLVNLPDGRVSVFSGVTKVAKNMQGSQVLRTETYDPDSATWTENYTGPASEASLPLVARLMLMPNGKILYSGSGQMWSPFGEAVDEATWLFQSFWDPETSEWEMLGPAPFGVRNGAAQVLLTMEPPYDRATVMDIGGTLVLPSPGSLLGTPITTLTTVTADGTVTYERTGDLNTTRWHSSAVTLPTGEVLTVSGADRDQLVTPGTEFPRRVPELYDPETRTWTPMASGARDRTYHNSAVLLPDGRVLVGGHAPHALGGPTPFVGAPHDAVPGVTANNDRDSSFEVFSPPYLFRGDRPAIAEVQRGIAWGSGFAVATPDAQEITGVVLSRLPSVQHTIDPDQRTLRLPFTKTAGSLTAMAPPSGVVAPPGFYYLFLMKQTSAGPVPSVARIVRLDDGADMTAAPRIYASDDPPPPDASIGATEPENSSYPNELPPPPLGFAGLGSGSLVLAMRRRGSGCRSSWYTRPT